MSEKKEQCGFCGCLDIKKETISTTYKKAHHYYCAMCKRIIKVIVEDVKEARVE